MKKDNNRVPKILNTIDEMIKSLDNVQNKINKLYELPSQRHDNLNVEGPDSISKWGVELRLKREK